MSARRSRGAGANDAPRSTRRFAAPRTPTSGRSPARRSVHRSRRSRSRRRSHRRSRRRSTESIGAHEQRNRRPIYAVWRRPPSHLAASGRPHEPALAGDVSRAFVDARRSLRRDARLRRATDPAMLPRSSPRTVPRVGPRRVIAACDALRARMRYPPRSIREPWTGSRAVRRPVRCGAAHGGRSRAQCARDRLAERRPRRTSRATTEGRARPRARLPRALAARDVTDRARPRAPGSPRPRVLGGER